MKSKEEVREQFETQYKISKHGCRRQWRHIQECQTFYSGDYMNYRDEFAFGRGSSRRIRQVQFNRVKPYVNSVVGFIAQLRRKPDYQARMEDKEEQAALSDYVNGFSDYVRDNANADQMESQQDMDLVIGGLGVTDTCITTKEGDPTRDPNGEILIERVNPIHCGWDPGAIHPNILDSRWVYRAKDYDVEEAVELFDTDEDQFETADEGDGVNNYEFNPYGGIQDKIGFEWADPQRRMVRVYFYQWFEIENFFRIENPILSAPTPQVGLALAEELSKVEVDQEEELFRFDPTSSILVMTKDNRKEIKEIFELFGIPFKPMTDKRKVYYTAVISGKKVFTAYKSVSQQGFSLKFKTGNYDERSKYWTGLVASMRDPQKYYNKSLTELMLIIANNSRGGVIYEEDAIDNVQEFEAKWALTNAAVRVNPGALSGGKIQPKAIPAMPTGYEGIMEISSRAMSQVTGIDETFFGTITSGNETAMLQRQRIKQATTTLVTYFDSIALYSKEQARMMLSFMRLLAESSDGKLFSMFDDEGGVLFERISSDYFVDEYEVSIGETPETPLQQEYYTTTLLNMAQTMQAIGDPRYTEMYAAAVKYMPFPNRDKSTIVQILMGDQKIDPRLVQQMQAKIQELEGEQAQLMNANLMANINKTNAEAAQKTEDARLKAAQVEETDESTENQALENDLIYAKEYDKVTVNI